MLRLYKANTGKYFNLFRPFDELNNTCLEFERDLLKALTKVSKEERLSFLTELYNLVVLSEFPKKNYQEIQNVIFKLNSEISIYFYLSQIKKGEELVSAQPQLFAEYSSYSHFLFAVKRMVFIERNKETQDANSHSFRSMLLIQNARFYEFLIEQFMISSKTDVAALVIVLFKFEILKKTYLDNIKRLRDSLLEIPIPVSVVGSYAYFSKKVKLYIDDAELRYDDRLKNRVEIFMEKVESELKSLNAPK